MTAYSYTIPNGAPIRDEKVARAIAGAHLELLLQYLREHSPERYAILVNAAVAAPLGIAPIWDANRGQFSRAELRSSAASIDELRWAMNSIRGDLETRRLALSHALPFLMLTDK